MLSLTHKMILFENPETKHTQFSRSQSLPITTVLYPSFPFMCITWLALLGIWLCNTRISISEHFLHICFSSFHVSFTYSEYIRCFLVSCKQNAAERMAKVPQGWKLKIKRKFSYSVYPLMSIKNDTVWMIYLLHIIVPLRTGTVSYSSLWKGYARHHGLFKVGTHYLSSE